MKNNLVKEQKSVEINGKKKTIYNYYIVFENGTKLPIVVRLYDTTKAEKDKKEQLERVNYSNSQLLFAFADLVENGKDKD